MPYPVVPNFPIAVMNESFLYNNITTNTTTTVKSGAGTLHWCTVNTAPTGTGQSITIYDSTTASGTKIGTHTSPVQGAVYEYDIAFTNGLTIVTASGTLPGDFTISYR
jgi:hypothetical protein